MSRAAVLRDHDAEERQRPVPSSTGRPRRQAQPAQTGRGSDRWAEFAGLVVAAAEARGGATTVLRPVERWSAEEREKRALLERGVAMAVNMRRHGHLIAWAKERGLFVRVDRATPGALWSLR